MRWRRERGGFVPPHWGVFEEKNEAAIYRRMEKKKTMKEIKKEMEKKWNLSGR